MPLLPFQMFECSTSRSSVPLFSRHELVFCYTILEANKRLLLLLAASLGTQSVTPTTNYLDAFFPFDPYFLHRYGTNILLLPYKIVTTNTQTLEIFSPSNFSCYTGVFFITKAMCLFSWG